MNGPGHVAGPEIEIPAWPNVERVPARAEQRRRAVAIISQDELAAMKRDVAVGLGMRRLLESAIGAVQQKAEALLAATHHKAAVLGERAQTAAELVTGQKVAALAAR